METQTCVPLFAIAFGAANFGYFAVRRVGRRLLGLEPALAIRFDSNFFARSNSARRLRLSPLPARLMKYVSILIPETGPFGDTLRDANARAIVLASFVNSPACGWVESVLTFATQRWSVARVVPRGPAFRCLCIYPHVPIRTADTSSSGSIGLLTFALVAWRLLPSFHTALVLIPATLGWLVVSGSLWYLRRRIPTIWAAHSSKRRARDVEYSRSSHP